MIAKVRTPSGATHKGVLQLEATFNRCEKHVSPPGLGKACFFIMWSELWNGIPKIQVQVPVEIYLFHIK